MKKTIFIFLLAAVFAICVHKAYAMCGMCGGAGHSHGKKEAAAAETKAVDAGNKVCPVTDEKIDEKAKTTYEYDGKIYNFCCPMCIDEFKKDPKKYIGKIEAAEKKEHAGHHQM